MGQNRMIIMTVGIEPRQRKQLDLLKERHGLGNALVVREALSYWLAQPEQVALFRDGHRDDLPGQGELPFQEERTA